MKKRIKNATIYDGTGAAPFTGDILIRDGFISEVGTFPETEEDEIIDAAGRAAAPGFIDSHRHCDFAAVCDPDFGAAELAQGITSALGGNCGLSAYPASPESGAAWYDFIEPCLGKGPEDGSRWESFPRYLEALRAADLRIHVGGLIGTGAVKTAARGFAPGPFTAAEMERAQAYLIEAMEAGAFGVSAGIMYTPECYSTKEEFVRLLRPAGRYGRPLSCHIRREGDGLAASVEEIIDICARAEMPLNISHFKSVGRRNWRREIFTAIEKIEAARARGQDVTVDFYPYTGGSTTLLTLLPPSFVEADTAATLRKLETLAGVETLRRLLAQAHPGWDNMVRDIGWERIVISAVTCAENKRFQGRNIRRICEEEGYSDETAFISGLLVQEKGKVSIIVMSMAQEDVDEAARLPYSMVISDSLYGAPDFPHPRLYGSFSRILREYVNERRILPPETAIHKMTGMTAQRFSIPGRGRIAPGFHADINLFTLEEVRDQATFADPKRLSQGMDEIFLNGERVWRKGRPLPVRAAQVLTR